MKRRKQTTSPAKVGAAVALLLLGGWMSLRGLGTLGAPAPLSTAGGDVNAIRDEEPTDVEGAAPVRTDLGDLLLQVGSYRQGQKLGSAFRRLSPQPVASAPAGETAALAAAGGLAFEPVPMRVSFVMVGGDLTRACVDGIIVGLGATVAAGTITAIRHEGVEVQTHGQTLFYDLTAPLPREYRAEAARRSAQDQPEEGAK